LWGAAAGRETSAVPTTKKLDSKAVGVTSLAPREGTAGFLLVLVLLVVGFGLATIGWVDYAAARDTTENAEPIEVTVLESEVTDSGGSSSDRTYSISVLYEYEVDGETYRSSNVRPGLSDRSYEQRHRAATVARKYPVNETATGYVDPENPERAYLEQPSPVDRLERNVVNAGLTAVGVLIFLVSAVGAVRSAALVER
jgi:hypothetical protein